MFSNTDIALTILKYCNMDDYEKMYMVNREIKSIITTNASEIIKYIKFEYVIDKYGIKRSYYKNMVHSYGEHPAIIFPNGTCAWYKLGRLTKINDTVYSITKDNSTLDELASGIERKYYDDNLTKSISLHLDDMALYCECIYNTLHNNLEYVHFTCYDRFSCHKTISIFKASVNNTIIADIENGQKTFTPIKLTPELPLLMYLRGRYFDNPNNYALSFDGDGLKKWYLENQFVYEI